MRVVFIGTPEFAIPSLKVLYQHYDVVGVITAPTKPQGRNKQLIAPPVKMFADEHGIPVLQPEKLRSHDFLNALYSLNADIYVVVAFRMLPECVWAHPKFGTINLHASLLPNYRGAAPINWAIINGEKYTGVSTFFINNEIDTGNIILQEKEPISFNDTANTLSNRLMQNGAQLLLKTVQLVENGKINTTQQNCITTTHTAPKIFSDYCAINFYQPTLNVYNFIRGLSKDPGAWTTICGIRCKIYACHPVDYSPSNPGQLHTDSKNYLYIETIDGAISIDEIHPAGKKSMNIKSFLAGYGRKITSKQCNIPPLSKTQ